MAKSWTTHQIQLAGDELSHLDREWLITNGAGGYAMGTLPGVNTRRYHGLFVPAVHPPVGRVLAVNQMFEQLELTSPVGKQTIEFSSCRFPDKDGQQIFAPQGHTMLRRVDRGLDVTWVYQFKHVQFIRKLSLAWKCQSATLAYTVAGLAKDESATLRLSPMVTLRDFHGLQSSKTNPNYDVQSDKDTATITLGDVGIALQCAGAEFIEDSSWWYDLFYAIEAHRGMDHSEDNFLPGRFELPCQPTEVNTFTLGMALVGESEEKSTGREAHLLPIAEQIATFAQDDKQAQLLAIASDDFIVTRTVGERTLSTILAGYPWFADWGRDTFIALSGLMIVTGRYDEARDTLHAFASALRNGLIPNRFDDYDQSTAAAHYNNVDGSMWFIRAALQYMDATNDEATWNDWLCDAIRSIIDAYIKGTDNNIKMAGDGMISAGSADTQLTWMDAKNDGVVFTPRQGKAVEINALWYHALAGMSERLEQTDKRTSVHYHKLTQRIKRAFAKVFWDDELGYLRDHVWIGEDGNEHADRSLRPNMIFAASLPHSPMPQTKQKLIVKTVKQRLLTPFGLRTLPEDDRNYHAHYAGSPFERDKSYHQGIIWPWLIGPYAEAVLRANRFSDAARQEAHEAIEPLLSFMNEPGLGQLYEIHDPTSPFAPEGCMAQAWSVAEVLRVLALIAS